MYGSRTAPIPDPTDATPSQAAERDHVPRTPPPEEDRPPGASPDATPGTEDEPETQRHPRRYRRWFEPLSDI